MQGQRVVKLRTRSTMTRGQKSAIFGAPSPLDFEFSPRLDEFVFLQVSGHYECA